jgi:hypothetical protein
MEREADVWIHEFLTSALDRGEWSTSHPARFNSKERGYGTQWTGSLVRPTPSLDTVEKTKIRCPFRESNLKSHFAQPIDSAVPTELSRLHPIYIRSPIRLHGAVLN